MMQKLIKKGKRMKQNCIGKIITILVFTMLLVGKSHTRTPHSAALDHKVLVVKNHSASQENPTQSVSEYTPPAPYNNVTFTITAPVKVCVGQSFTIDYAIKVSKFTFISHWSDLIPDQSQEVNAKLIAFNHPTIGSFNSDEPSKVRKGGCGNWVFPKGLPAGTVQHLRVTLQATTTGLLKFATIVGINPPFYIETNGTLVSCNPPVASKIHLRGLSEQPLEISLLDYISSVSALEVASITQPSYGSAVLNPDYTVTYTPYPGFYGDDSFNYKVTDAAENVINGIVTMNIEQAPIPQIIQ